MDCRIFLMITLFLCGALMFLVGFFPVSYETADADGSSTAVTTTGRPTFLNGYKLTPVPQKYAEIILMLVDALRYDFPTNDSMPFASGSACATIKVRVHIPTVTLPRLKSITTGTVSNFIDIVLNLGHAEQLDDSLLHRLKQRGDIVVFAGDRTWVQLFPSEFRRKYPNIDSFYVQDFYEGDKNVTRALEQELKPQHLDWSLLILHYLGLDHIGHVEGTASSKIPPKLREMDDVVRKILHTEHYKNQLLLLTGDHGMRNGGGHGGSTLEELYVPLMIFSANCTKSNKVVEYDQMDLAPTLAILLSIGIPNASIGCLIPELLKELSLEEQLYAYHYNAMHLMHKATAKFGKKTVHQSAYSKWYLDATNSHTQFLKEKRIHDYRSTFSFEKAKLNYIRLAREISSELSKSLVNFNYGLIVIGISLTSATTVSLLMSVFLTQPGAKLHVLPNMMHAWLSLGLAVIVNLWCHYAEQLATQSLFRSCLLTLPIAACISIVMGICKRLLKLAVAQSTRPLLRFKPSASLLACFVFHTCSLASSSFIEEEHQTWYYLGTTALIVLFARSFHSGVVRGARDEAPSVTPNIRQLVSGWLQLCAMRWPLLMVATVALLRRLNQSGDKWRNLHDLGKELNKNENKTWLSLFFILGLLMVLLTVRKYNTPPRQLFGYAMAALCVYCFRAMDGAAIAFFPLNHIRSTPIVAAFWACVSISSVIRYKSVILRMRKSALGSGSGFEPKDALVEWLQTNLCGSLLIVALLQKLHNVILLPAMLFTLEQAYALCDNLRPKEPRWQSKQQSAHIFQKTLLTIFVANMFYFYQGNTNSLATIDLNPGYIGQSSYNPLIVAIFVTLNTYSAHINAFACLILHTLNPPKSKSASSASNPFSGQEKERPDLQLVISIYIVSVMLPAAVYFCLLVAFRYHLFIYSVFSPKVLYECYSVVVFYFNIVITSLYLKIFK